jgi:26S proteasome regulatory subunit N3
MHGSTFHSEGTHTLILRLRHNVIKTGLAQISQAYSKISLRDICVKLQLDNEEDAEYIVTKAIRDGVVSAGVGVDHEKGWLVSKEKVDLLETAEPRKVFGKRIDFCLQLHNESVKVRSIHLASLARACDK